MTREQLIAKFPHASASFIKANLDRVMGGMEAAQPEPTPTQTLEKLAFKQPSRKTGVVAIVTFIACRRRILDTDNAVGACKPLRDAVSESFGCDDADPRIDWRYEQIRAQQEGVIVLIQANL